jgi:excisionase family DNA binding protein
MSLGGTGVVRVADLPELPTVAQVADVIGCGQRLVRSLIASGALEQVRLSRYVRVKRSSVERLVEQGTDAMEGRAKALRKQKPKTGAGVASAAHWQ